MPPESFDGPKMTPPDQSIIDELFAYTATEQTTAAIEAERRRLAALLQSNVATPLRLLLAQVNAYERSLNSNPAAHRAILTLSMLARQVLQQVHDLEVNLQPAILETLGLEQALDALVNQAMRAYGLQITLVLEPLPERLTPPLELALFRAAQDALERAIHQARASHVTIHLTHQNEQLIFNLADNGLVESDETLLKTTRQRLEQLGGTIKTGKSPEGDFEVTLIFTIKARTELTPRELEVLHLLAEGLSNKEIARRLSVTPRTVNFHLDNLYSKLGVNSRTEAVIWALRSGRLSQSSTNLFK